MGGGGRTMSFTVVPDRDRLDVTTVDGRRFTFAITELQATRRTPRPGTRASDLPISSQLRVLEDARRAAEEFAILNDMM